MDERPTRIGLIGCGMIGQIHADSLRMLSDDGEVVAIGAADPSRAAREAVARNCPFRYLTGDSMEVIGDPGIDAVIIASPTSSHHQLVVSALESGKPVLCEKPVAPEVAQVRELSELVEASGLVAHVGFHSRFHPLVNHLRDAVLTQEMGAPMGYVMRDDQYWPTGDVVSGHSSWRSKRAEAGGGALLEHSIHAADIVSWLFGPARRVCGYGRSVFGYDVEDVAAISVEHESGVVGTLLTVFNGVRGREERRFEVFFESGAVEVTTDFIVGASEDSYKVQRPDRPGELLDVAELRDEHFSRRGIVRRDFIFYTYPSDLNWVRAVRRNKSQGPGFREALRAHGLVDAAYRSMFQGEVVEVET